MGKVAIIDIGGTYTRIGLTSDIDNSKSNQSLLKFYKEKIGSKNAFFSLIKKALSNLKGNDYITKSVICFAGPITARNEIRLTNWKFSAEIQISELYSCGLPVGKTLLLNDMEAAAYGLIDVTKSKILSKSEFLNLFLPPKNILTESEHNNMVLLSPGTGLGTVGIVTLRTSADCVYIEPIPSEIQHCEVSPLDEQHLAIIKWLKENNRISKIPVWEDFASGRGLMNIYHALSSLYPSHNYLSLSIDDVTPSKISYGAIVENIEICKQALDIYYRCTARVAQLLSLTFQPYGGVYLSGESTVSNSPFICESKFMFEFHKNSSQKNLLLQFPVYLIKKDLNLIGGLWAAKNRMHLCCE